MTPALEIATPKVALPDQATLVGPLGRDASLSLQIATQFIPGERLDLKVTPITDSFGIDRGSAGTVATNENLDLTDVMPTLGVAAMLRGCREGQPTGQEAESEDELFFHGFVFSVLG